MPDSLGESDYQLQELVQRVEPISGVRRARIHRESASSTGNAVRMTAENSGSGQLASTVRKAEGGNAGDRTAHHSGADKTPSTKSIQQAVCPALALH